MNLIAYILESLWFLVPAYTSNMMPVFVKDIPFLKIPVDLGKKIRGKPIFGFHKTYRGFFFGTLGAIMIVYIQKLLYLNLDFIRKISLIDYSTANIFLVGFLLGFGALFGDLVKSFFKRKKSIPPGKSWVPFDQLDYIIGSLVFIAPIYLPSFFHILTMIMLSVALHFISVWIAYYMGLRKSKI